MKSDSPSTEKSLSRRRFLGAAVAGSAAISATSALADIAASRPGIEPQAPRDPLEQFVEKYGSEFGDMRQVR